LRMRNATIGIILLAVGVTGIAALTFFSAGTLDMDRAESIAQRYLASLNDQDLGIEEIMEFEYNFYAMYYKSTGIGAFENHTHPTKSSSAGSQRLRIRAGPSGSHDDHF